MVKCKGEPKLSIITIAYNNLVGLRKTAESVLAQTYHDFEWIIVDGASTDGTQDYLSEISRCWKGLSERLQIVSEQDTGIYNAMNKGIRIAHGEYLQFLNGGDYFVSPEVLGEIFGQQHNADILYGNRIDVFCSGETKAWLAPEHITAYFLWQGTISHQASFIRRALFKKIGLYREDLIFGSDWEFFLKAFVRHNATSEYINQYVVYFERGGISTNIAYREELLAERRHVFEETFPYLVNDFQYMDTCIETLCQYDRRANTIGKKLLFFPRKIYSICKVVLQILKK